MSCPFIRLFCGCCCCMFVDGFFVVVLLLLLFGVAGAFVVFVILVVFSFDFKCDNVCYWEVFMAAWCTYYFPQRRQLWH